MAQFDTNGREYARPDDLSNGDCIEADEGFTCLDAGPHKVCSDSDGWFIFCRGPDDQPPNEPCRHYLDGQDDGDGYLVGINPKIFP